MLFNELLSLFQRGKTVVHGEDVRDVHKPPEHVTLVEGGEIEQGSS